MSVGAPLEEGANVALVAIDIAAPGVRANCGAAPAAPTQAGQPQPAMGMNTGRSSSCAACSLSRRLLKIIAIPLGSRLKTPCVEAWIDETRRGHRSLR